MEKFTIQEIEEMKTLVSEASKQNEGKNYSGLLHKLEALGESSKVESDEEKFLLRISRLGYESVMHYYSAQAENHNLEVSQVMEIADGLDYPERFEILWGILEEMGGDMD